MLASWGSRGGTVLRFVFGLTLLVRVARIGVVPKGTRIIAGENGRKPQKRESTLAMMPIKGPNEALEELERIAISNNDKLTRDYGSVSQAMYRITFLKKVIEEALRYDERITK